MQSAARVSAKIPGTSLLIVIGTTGCPSSVLAEYQASKAEILGAPEELAANWKPEVRVRLSPDLAEAVVAAVLEEGLSTKRAITVSGPLGASVRVEPSVDVKELSLGAAKSCERCVNARASLDGKVGYDVAGFRGSVPLHGQLAVDVALQLVRTADDWSASASVEDVQSLQIEVPHAGKVELAGGLEQWARSGLREAPAIPLGSFGGGGLPIRAARVAWNGDAAELEGATDVVGGAPVSAGGGAPAGWSVSLDTQTLLALARRAAFEKGALSHDVAVDPKALRIEDGGAFTLDLRLWRLTGAGWWRDYTVHGTLAIDGGKLVVRSDDVTETGKSRGAGFADPLALLVEGRILQSIADAFDRAIPLRTGSIGGITPRASAISVEGSRVTLEGTASR
jgi:hypothetical protein